ncbi:MAG: AEC family transporter [Lachnospiraceae bacterium]|nr:AEC family transporter [Lachnospiraceae bacterium]
MENLIFSLNATIPIFLLMVIGYVLKEIHFMDEAFALKLNSFVFKVSLPCLLFNDLSVVDFATAWDSRFVFFCAFTTICSILIAFVFSLAIKEKSLQGEFIQVTYRSSAAILGLAFIQNIYGSTGMGPLMIVASVPLYNICAVIVLSFFSPNQTEKPFDQALIKKTLLGILKNPILIGIVVGLLWSALSLPTPGILMKTAGNIGATATPLGLIAMGACFNFKEAFECGKASLFATFTKLFGFVGLFLPFAIHMGYRKEELVAILVMLGSASTVSCFVMAKNMGHKGTLTSATVMLTTLFSAFSLTFWLYLMKSMGFI